MHELLSPTNADSRRESIAAILSTADRLRTKGTFFWITLDLTTQKDLKIAQITQFYSMKWKATDTANDVVRGWGFFFFFIFGSLHYISEENWGRFTPR